LVPVLPALQVMAAMRVAPRPSGAADARQRLQRIVGAQ
jgi:hypothetical protein